MTNLRVMVRGLAVAVMALAVGAGLSCKAEPGARPGGSGKLSPTPEVTVWQGFGPEETVLFEDIMRRFEKQWEAENPGRDLRLKLEYVAYGDLPTRLRTAALANIAPDVAFMDSIKVTDMAFGSALVPLDTLEGFKKRYKDIDDARQQFVQASFNAGVVNRLGETNLYGLPVQTTTVALFWNRSMFRAKAAELTAAGLNPNRPPQTWDEMIAYGKVLTDPERNVHAFGLWNSLWFTFPYLNMYNVEVIRYDDKGRASAALATDRGVAAMETIRKLTDSGVEGGAWKSGALGPDQGFVNGVYAMCLTGPWKFQEFTNAKMDFDIALIPAPSPEEVSRLGLQSAAPQYVETLGNLAYSASNVGGQTGVLLRSADEAEISYELLEFFTGAETQKVWGEELGQIPVRKAAWAGLDMSKHPHIPKFMKQLEFSRRVPQIPLWGTLEQDCFNKEFDLFLNGKTTAKEMLQRVEAEMNKRIIDKINDVPES